MSRTRSRKEKSILFIWFGKRESVLFSFCNTTFLLRNNLPMTSDVWHQPEHTHRVTEVSVVSAYHSLTLYQRPVSDIHPPWFTESCYKCRWEVWMQRLWFCTHVVFLKFPVVLLGQDLLHHRHGLPTLPDVLLLLETERERWREEQNFSKLLDRKAGKEMRMTHEMSLDFP